MSVAMLTGRQLATLKRCDFVADVENEGMEDDRFLVHLKEGFRWNMDRSRGVRTKGFDSFAQASLWVQTRIIHDD